MRQDGGRVGGHDHPLPQLHQKKSTYKTTHTGHKLNVEEELKPPKRARNS